MENQELNKEGTILIVIVILIAFAGGFMLGYIMDLRKIQAESQTECNEWIAQNCPKQFIQNISYPENITIPIIQ